MNNRVAILSMDSLEGFFSYDHLLEQPFREHGIQVEMVSWRDAQCDWNRYDAVIIRTTWDYQDDCDAFLRVLQTIEASSARLMNSLAVTQWNISKTYLRELEERGVPVVPTLWASHLNANALAEARSQWPNRDLIVKPAVSANADDTFPIPTSESSGALLQRIGARFPEGRDVMLQPFLDSIVENGEYSLFYFGGEYSHAIKKCPKNGDFRVQEEHGGTFALATPSTAIKAVAEQALACVNEELLYARIDVAMLDDQTPAIIEMELIEPSLYFGVDAASPKRFVQAYLKLTKE
ncbi:ATP-grasp domain-containing protein [Pseudidiomarina sp.]|uniref:ATP-grasp domain-containing protein n=1 Tax=Pseudidiomarina sp. TaxID=2081707 RepID=UPI003A96FB78